MLVNKNEEFIERTFHILCSGYSYLYEKGKQEGHWEDIRGTALAGIALDLKEAPDSVWLRLIRNYLVRTQSQEGDVTGSWGEEVWDTSMCVLALKSFEVSSRDPLVKSSIDWIASLYRVSERNNWHDEPWETCWALMAILTAGTIPSNLKIEEPVKWLLEFQEENGKIIAPHYTAYYLLIWDKLNKTTISSHDKIIFDEAKQKCANYLIEVLRDSPSHVLWTGEAWSNGQILWALLSIDGIALDDELLNKVLNWFETNQGKQGNWSDIEDTASAIIGLYFLLEHVLSASTSLRNKDIKQTLQKRLPCPDVYIKRAFIEQNKESGGISINLDGGTIKILAVLGAIGGSIATGVSLFDYFKKFF